MDAQEQSYQRAEELYCLALLLTGDPELSAILVVEAINLQNGPEAPFASGLHSSLRKQFIANALARIRGALSMSATRWAAEKNKKEELPPPSWILKPDTTAAQIKHVLLAMDIFPRCALLLTVFEGLTLDEASTLMIGDPQLVLDARIAALRALTLGLARMEKRPPCSQLSRYESQSQHSYGVGWQNTHPTRKTIKHSVSTSH